MLFDAIEISKGEQDKVYVECVNDGKAVGGFKTSQNKVLQDLQALMDGTLEVNKEKEQGFKIGDIVYIRTADLDIERPKPMCVVGHRFDDFGVDGMVSSVLVNNGQGTKAYPSSILTTESP